MPILPQTPDGIEAEHRIWRRRLAALEPPSAGYSIDTMTTSPTGRNGLCHDNLQSSFLTCTKVTRVPKIW
jgi:hypothetical protein